MVLQGVVLAVSLTAVGGGGSTQEPGGGGVDHPGRAVAVHSAAYRVAIVTLLWGGARGVPPWRNATSGPVVADCRRRRRRGH